MSTDQTSSLRGQRESQPITTDQLTRRKWRLYFLICSRMFSLKSSSLKMRGPMALTSRRSASAKISLSALSMVPFSFLCCKLEHGVELRVRKTQTGRAPNVEGLQSEAAHFDKVVEEIHPLLQGFLQVIAQRQVLGMVADFLHAPPLRLLGGLLCPVLVFIISILQTQEGKSQR